MEFNGHKMDKMSSNPVLFPAQFIRNKIRASS